MEFVKYISEQSCPLCRDDDEIKFNVSNNTIFMVGLWMGRGGGCVSKGGVLTTKKNRFNQSASIARKKLSFFRKLLVHIKNRISKLRKQKKCLLVDTISFEKAYSLRG